MNRFRFLILFMMATFAYVARCEEFTVGNFNYETWGSDNIVTISKAENVSLSGALTIPSSVTYNGVTYTVCNIDWAGFCNTDITSVELPNTIVRIYTDAFSDCKKLEKINLPKGIVYLGSNLFYGCNSLKTIESHIFYPMVLSEGTFDNTNYSQISLVVPSGSLNRYKNTSGWKDFKTIIEQDLDDVDKEKLTYNAFNSQNASVAAANKNIDGDITIPSEVTIDGKSYTVTEIETEGFENCKSISSVTLPSTIKTIGSYAFADSGIESIDLNEGLQELGPSAFYGCQNLKSITIPKSVNYIYTNVFSGDCNNLSEIKVADGNTSYKVVDGMLLDISGTLLVAYAFGTPTENLVIPSTVTSLSQYGTFSGNRRLKTIVIPKNVTSIGGETFYECSSLTRVFYSDNVKTIGEIAFSNCPQLKTIVIPQGLTTLAANAFRSCPSVDSVIVRQLTPLEISSDYFDAETYERATLYVPIGRTKYFKEANGWKQFSKIVEIEMPGIELSASPYDNIDENQMLFGYYTTDDKAEIGNGYGGPSGGTYKVCVGFTEEQIKPFAGNKITNIRFALTDTNDIQDLQVWIGSSKDRTDLYSQQVDSFKTGWNEIALTTPFTLADDSLFIGIEYRTQDFNYPISCVSKGNEAGSAYFYGPYGDNGESCWIDRSDDLSLSLQCILEGESLPQYLIRMKNPIMGGWKSGRYYKAGERAEGEVYMKNWGKKNISSFEGEFQIDGNDVQAITFTKPAVDHNDYGSGYFEINLPANLSIGKHDLTYVIKSINGEENLYDKVSPATTLRVYSKSYERKHVLIDHLTAQWCPYCPRTDRTLNSMKKEHDDFIVITTQANDNLSCASTQEYNVLTSFYPALLYDRFAFAGSKDMYGYYELCKSQPSLMTLSVSAYYKDNNINIRVQGERNEEFEAVDGIGALTVLLTEDGIDAGQADADEGYHEHYIHDDVIRAAATDAWGDIIQWNGNTFDMAFTIPYNSQWNLSNMHAVAFASRRYAGNPGDINIFNSDKSDITQEVTGISSVRSDDDNETVAIYDAMGRRLDKPVKGVNILRYANGKSKKIIVK